MPQRSLALTSALVAGLASTALAQAAPPQPAVVLVDTAMIRAPKLSESSGIVASQRRAGIYWTVNDSGNDPLLFATDSAGTDLGYVRVAGASNVDWEDISIGACTRTRGTCLFISDTGDNGARRPHVVVYVVPEIEPPAGPADTARTVAVEDSIVMRFPDHPHDAEALVVTADWLLLVTKDRTGPAMLYRAPRLATGPRTLEFVTNLALQTSLIRGRIVTGAALSRSGTLFAVRTYTSLHLFELHGSQPVPLTDMNGLSIPVVETQGEGITFDAHGRLILSSERGARDHATITRLRLTGLPQR